MSENSNHDSKGRFTHGNRASQGRKLDRLKAAMLSAVTNQDIKAVISSLLESAKSGDSKAAGILLDRIFGRPHTNREPEQSKPMEYDDDGGEVVFDDDVANVEMDVDYDGLQRHLQEEFEKRVNERAEIRVREILAEREQQEKAAQ